MANLTQTAASVIPSAAAELVQRVAAVAITAGQVLYAVSVTQVGLADANGSATVAKVYGIAVNSAAAGQPVTVCLKDPALVIGATVVIGDVLILSTTAGAIAPVTDLASASYCTVLGVAVSTTAINFNPLAAGALKP
jgi:hypothetical protein